MDHVTPLLRRSRRTFPKKAYCSQTMNPRAHIPLGHKIGPSAMTLISITAFI